MGGFSSRYSYTIVQHSTPWFPHHVSLTAFRSLACHDRRVLHNVQFDLNYLTASPQTAVHLPPPASLRGLFSSTSLESSLGRTKVRGQYSAQCIEGNGNRVGLILCPGAALHLGQDGIDFVSGINNSPLDTLGNSDLVFATQ